MEEFAEPVSPHERAKRGILIGMLGLTVLSTIGLWLATDNELLIGVVTMIGAIGYSIGTLLWCQVDSVEHEIPLSTGIRIAIILIAFIAVPYYLFKSRGAREGAISLGFAFVFYLLIILVASVATLILSIADGRLDLFK